MLYKAYRIFGVSHSSTTTAQSGFMVDALLEGKILLDDGTIKDARSRLVDSSKRLKAKRLKHGWFIPRSDLRGVISFD
ncbi:MAG: hypothetical protein C5S47_02480 [Candidatus Methanogasteraceae archaeon]|nr:MAG: hypothetical protein C5S47_02480 [ANME-2 cluster archaeon]